MQLIQQNDLKQVLVFVRTKQGADRLVKQLTQSKISATAIHGDKNQQQRTQALNEFKEGKIQVLVATDVAARGLDIENLAYVINFELPTVPEDYIHRIGRTGRAGSKGNAISLVSNNEKEFLAGIEKLLKTKLIVKNVGGFEVGEGGLPRANDRKRSDDKATFNKTGIDKRSGKIARSHPGTYGRNKSSQPVDPIFSQPYVPMALVKKADVAENISRSIFKSNKKPIPALFAPPIVNNKSDQD